MRVVKPQPKASAKQLVTWVAVALCVAGLIGLLAFPVRTTFIRLAVIAFLILTWAGLLRLVWQIVFARTGVLIVSALLAAFIVLPGSQAIDQARLRHNYLQSLRRYDQVRYVYGGENPRGIDCSGLVRAGMVEALAKWACKQQIHLRCAHRFNYGGAIATQSTSAKAREG